MKNILIATIIYVISSLIFTFPLILSIDRSLPGVEFGGDSFQFMWNMYIFRDEISKGNNPFSTRQVFYPVGVNLAFHEYSPLSSAIGGLFFKNLILGMNILILVCLTGACLSMFFLARYLTKNYLISIVAGLMYGFSPIMFSYIESQHYYYILSSLFLPLGVLTLFKFFKEPKKIRYLLFLILIFWLTFFTLYYVAIIYLVSLILISMFKLITSKNKSFFNSMIKDRKIILTYLFSIFLTLIIPIFFLFFFLFNIQDTKNFSAAEHTLSETCSADLLGFILPDKLVSFVNLGYTPANDTPSYYFGISFIIIAFISFLKFKKDNNILALSLTGLVILSLSLGPKIHAGNILISKDVLTTFYWFAQLPFMGFIGCPVRFPIFTQLTIIILTILLINYLANKYNIPNKLVFLLLLALFLIEFAKLDMNLISVRVPRLYQQLAAYTDKKTILELPSGLTESKGFFGYNFSIEGLHAKQMYWQTIHRKPRIGGYISRIPQTTYQFFKQEKIISDIFTMTNYGGNWPGQIYTKDQVKDFIKKFNIGYIIFSPGTKQEEYLLHIEKLFEGIPYEKFTEEGFILIKLNL